MKTAHWVSGKIYLSGLLAALALSGLTGTSLAQAADGPKCTTKNTITADVVAIEQTYFYNRFGSFNPHGMIFALRDDVVDSENGQSLSAGLRPGKVRLRSDKRPRPLVLRVNEEDCLQVKFQNLLAPAPERGQKIFKEPIVAAGADLPVEAEGTATRSASMHVNGLDYVGIGADGANVGNNPSSLAAPGKTIQYTWYAKKIGGYLFYSMGAPAGNEGDGGQIDLGLFGSITGRCIDR